jgi:hypothetical protein
MQALARPLAATAPARVLLLPRMPAWPRLLLCMHLGPPRPLCFPCTWGSLRPRGPPPLRPLPAPAHIIEHLQYKAFATYVYDHCNICNIQIKHLQYTFERTATFEIYNCNMCETAQHMQHPNMKHTCIVIATYATLNLLLQHPDETYFLRIGFRSRLGERHCLQNTTLTSCFYKKYLWKSDICILL